MIEPSIKPKVFVIYCTSHSYYLAVAISKNLLTRGYPVTMDNAGDVAVDVRSIFTQELTVCDFCILILTSGTADGCLAYFKSILDVTQEYGSTVIPVLAYGFEPIDYQKLIEQSDYARLEGVKPHKLSLDNFEQSIELLCNDFLVPSAISLREIADSTHKQIINEHRNYLEKLSKPTQNEMLSEAFFGYGLLAFKQENYDEAVEAFNKAIRLNNRNAMAYYYRGSALMHLIDYPNALADLSQAIKMNPSLSSAYYNRAALYNARGDLKLALDDLNKSIELHPQKSLAFKLRASIRYKIDDIRGAITDYQEYLRLNTDRNSAEWQEAEQVIRDLQELLD